jgi:hypothetical protein
MGNGASPEVFTVLCGLSTRSLTAQLNGNDEFIKDCADPEDIPVRAFLPTGRQWDVSGSGVLDRNSLQSVINAQGYTKNYRFVFGEPANDQVFSGYWAGPGVLTNVSFGGNDDAFATVDLTIVSDGLWVFTEVNGGGGGTPTPVNALSLSDNSFTRGTAKTVSIVGATNGSTLSSTGLPSGFTINSGARTLAYDGSGSGASAPSFTLSETLAGASNSPRSTTVNLAISDGVAVNALTSPVDNELLLSPADGQQLTYA